MRLLGYTRVSTTVQNEDLQLDALREAGVERRDVFSDKTSGRRAAAQRPGMKRLLEYAEEGDTVVVWRIDRLGRSTVDVIDTVNLLLGRGVKIRSITDGIDPETAAGRLMLTILASFAEYDLTLIKERTAAGIEAAMERGTRFGRPPVDPAVVSEKLEIVADARSKGRSAKESAQLVGWSRATLYRNLAKTKTRNPQS